MYHYASYRDWWLEKISNKIERPTNENVRLKFDVNWNISGPLCRNLNVYPIILLQLSVVRGKRNHRILVHIIYIRTKYHLEWVRFQNSFSRFTRLCRLILRNRIQNLLAELFVFRRNELTDDIVTYAIILFLPNVGIQFEVSSLSHTSFVRNYPPTRAYVSANNFPHSQRKSRENRYKMASFELHLPPRPTSIVAGLSGRYLFSLIIRRRLRFQKRKIRQPVVVTFSRVIVETLE